MIDNDVLAQVQALHALIKNRYKIEYECVLVDAKGPDKGLMARVQIHLGTIFPQTKEGRELRLDALVAVLPILQPSGRPIELDSLNRLWLAELRALSEWLDYDEIDYDDSGVGAEALEALEAISSDNPEWWAVDIRDLMGYIKRPAINGRRYAQEEQKDNGQMHLLAEEEATHYRRKGTPPF